jgi:3-hydroxy-9,10-secoandrosta-1,3,5(10)-triene-9,17-dione monooxygenase
LVAALSSKNALTLHEELVGRARELAPKIAERARATEARRAPDPEIIRDLIDAELMQLLVPRRWGGHEASLRTHLEVVEVISAACLSTGWIAAFYIGHNCLATRFPEAAQKEFFADRPFALIPITNAPTLSAKRVDGGWIVSGQSAWASGIMDADWVCLGGKDDTNAAYVFAFPAADVEIDDVWHYAGMSGTGSNTAVVRDAFVPTHRALSAPDFASGRFAAELYENPLFSAPLMSVILSEVMPVYSGGLRGAANAFETIVRSRTAAYAKAKMSDNPRSHVLLGDALLNASIAERLVRDLYAQIEDGIEHHNIGIAQRIAFKAQSAFIAEHCRRAVNEMAHYAGSSNFHLDSPIQRFFRDLNTLATHVFCDWDTSRELLGRDRLGLAPNHPIV